jgi:type IV secretory pathway VirB10-like protein
MIIRFLDRSCKVFQTTAVNVIIIRVCYLNGAPIPLTHTIISALPLKVTRTSPVVPLPSTAKAKEDKAKELLRLEQAKQLMSEKKREEEYKVKMQKLQQHREQELAKQMKLFEQRNQQQLMIRQQQLLFQQQQFAFQARMEEQRAEQQKQLLLQRQRLELLKAEEAAREEAAGELEDLVEDITFSNYKPQRLDIGRYRK